MWVLSEKISCQIVFMLKKKTIVSGKVFGPAQYYKPYYICLALFIALEWIRSNGIIGVE